MCITYLLDVQKHPQTLNSKSQEATSVERCCVAEEKMWLCGEKVSRHEEEGEVGARRERGIRADAADIHHIARLEANDRADVGDSPLDVVIHRVFIAVLNFNTTFLCP